MSAKQRNFSPEFKVKAAHGVHRTGFSACLPTMIVRVRKDFGKVLLAAAMIGLGIRGLVYGDFTGMWHRIPIEHLPAGVFFVYLIATLELATGIGLLVRRTLAVASAILVVLLLLWEILLRLPNVIAMPLVEVNWLRFGEIAVILAGGWAVFALNAGEWAHRRLKFVVGCYGVRGARLLFAVALPMIGLSLFVYIDITVNFVPAWLPWRHGWAYLIGAADIAAAAGVLFGVWPRLATTLVAAMLSVITLLAWLPGLIAAPSNASWTAFLMSSAIACGAWAVADSYRRVEYAAHFFHGKNHRKPAMVTAMARFKCTLWLARLRKEPKRNQISRSYQ